MAEGLTSQANPLPDDDLVAEYLNAKARPIRAALFDRAYAYIRENC